jgi:HNH endonuclease
MFTGAHPSSLGLHPAVYFYSSNGRHQPTAVLAMAQFVTDLLDQNKLLDFCAARSRVEDFLISHKMYINQLTSKYGSMTKGYRHIRDYFWFVFECAHSKKTERQIEAALTEHDRFQILVKEKPILTKKAKPFSADAKQLKLISDTLKNSLTCTYCGAKIDGKSMHLDHAKEKMRGGLATTDNAEWAHPYCDSTYKAYKAKSVAR